jgi:NAD(P)-dependent dehydrogenase (short-subunit alcohol dehydrogenase family)
VTVRDRFGRLDVMFNHAGVLDAHSIEDVHLANWNRVVAINLTGVRLGSQTAIKLMKQNPGGASGSIISTASTTSFMGIAQSAAYTATKGGVNALAKLVAVYGAQGLKIRCNALVPGATMTGITQTYIDSSPDALERVSGMAPLGRIGQPAELAAMALFLASDESSFCTGGAFCVDGGMLSAHPGM